MTKTNDDCYFYYYSSCAKGDACKFRHCAAALGTETVCPMWQQDRCFSQNCKLRHAEIVKDRKSIPCYWESQPGGCQKEHCVFMHSKPKANPVQGRLANSQTADATEPGGMKKSGSQADLIKENAVPSPKVNPVLITVDHDDENSNGDKVTSPNRSFSPIKVTGPKTIRTKKSLEKAEEPSQLNFVIKSLEQIRKEKERLMPECTSGSVSSNSVGSGPVNSLPESSLAAAAKDSEQTPSTPVKQQGTVKGTAVVKASDKLRQERSQKNVVVAAALDAGSMGSPSLQRSPVKLSTSQAVKITLPTKSQDVTEIRIKTFAEIMEEKRKRKELALIEGGADTAKAPEVIAGPATTSARRPTTQGQSRRISGTASTKDGSVSAVDAVSHSALPHRSSATDDKERSAGTAVSSTAAAATAKECSTGRSRPTASVAPLGESRVDGEQGVSQRPVAKRKPSASTNPPVSGSDEVGSSAKKSRPSEQAEGALSEAAPAALRRSSSSSSDRRAAPPPPSGGDEAILLDDLDAGDEELDELLRSDGDAVAAGNGSIRSSASVASVNDDDLMREMAVLLQ